MLDMAFQLLAFFVMTYHPSAFETKYDVQQTLPPEKQTKKKLGSGGSRDPKDLKDSRTSTSKNSPTIRWTPNVPNDHDLLRAADSEGYGRSKGDPTQISIKKPEGTEIVANAEDAFDAKTARGPS